MSLPIERIEPNPFQARTHFAKSEIAELADSIQEKGLLNKILVRPHPEKEGIYQLVHGERRLRACKLLEWLEIPATIQDLTDDELRKRFLKLKGV